MVRLRTIWLKVLGVDVVQTGFSIEADTTVCSDRGYLGRVGRVLLISGIYPQWAVDIRSTPECSRPALIWTYRANRFV